MADSESFPYLTIPAQARWRDAVAGRPPAEIDPHLGTSLRITPADRIASAGSCFAQRISEALQAAGYDYLITEPGPPFLTAGQSRTLGYGVYSARYGNVYSAAQLLQLLRRAFGRFAPAEPMWRRRDGRYADPFRPAVQPDGFESESELLRDREAHLAAVRRVFREADVLIFTLGLTETWRGSADGAVFPACPGSRLGGTYDPAAHVFHNSTAAEVTAELTDFVAELSEVNPRAQLILTVSPVPLLATYEPRHVLQATTYSKSVLRVAAEETVRRHPNVHYFASYEIVVATGDSRSSYLDDGRTVSDEAVDHVVTAFHRQFTGASPAGRPIRPDDGGDPAAARAGRPAGTGRSEQPMCDEDLVMEMLADQTATGHDG